LLLEAPEARALSRFFRTLKERVVARWQSKEGLAYDRVLYTVSYPYAKGDVELVLEWAGRPQERARLPAVRELNHELTSRPYPQVAPLAPAGVSAQSWSALLHFLDPSYPLATPESYVGVLALGFPVEPRLDARGYPGYLAAVDTLKDEAPVFAVPETNWYLARVIQVGLEKWRGADGRA
jgi:hypothetical protein